MMWFYNLLHRFLVGDFIWQLPTMLAGALIAAPLLFKKRWKLYLSFVIWFLILSILLHILIEPYIHEFQRLWTAPMGPGLELQT
jgi:hypothetical protein